ncbi:sensor histidine kinase [Pontibacter litorisediminis]|uniref:sensor histidine kinase n=1 Tax=Pontibacter litorisediminis TaxID=1846260 RepID=UPI0023EDC9D3|nr:histidine kinase [Pontibacter litorisediminis]
MKRQTTPVSSAVITFIWSILALVILLQIYITHVMPIPESMVYVTVLVLGHMAGAHALGDLVLPRFIRNRQMLRFVPVLLLSCVTLAVLLACVDVWLEHVLHFKTPTPDGTPLPFIPRVLGLFVGILLTSSAICGIRFYTEHSRMEKKHQQLRAEHLEAELKLLRDQINPHFMFNVLNSIHVLMHRDKEQASEVLFRFADMLRYQLYECSQATIPLEQEIAYLQSYAQIEQVRHGSELRLEADWGTLPYSYTIAPFILAPFVENAFKHVSRSAVDGSFIQISLRVEKDTLRLMVWNSCEESPEAEQPGKAGGIGLENVRKRLELLYPGNYELQAEQAHGVYHVLLKLNLAATQARAPLTEHYTLNTP